MCTKKDTCVAVDYDGVCNLGQKDVSNYIGDEDDEDKKCFLKVMPEKDEETKETKESNKDKSDSGKKDDENLPKPVLIDTSA